MTRSFDNTAETVGFELPEGKKGMFSLSIDKIGGHAFSRIVFKEENGTEHKISEHFSFSADAFVSAQERLQIERLLSEANNGLRESGKYKYIRQVSRQPVQ